MNVKIRKFSSPQLKWRTQDPAMWKSEGRLKKGRKMYNFIKTILMFREDNRKALQWNIGRDHLAV